MNNSKIQFYVLHAKEKTNVVDSNEIRAVSVVC